MSDATYNRLDAAPLKRAMARQRDASDPDVSVWVAASAGTGKTKVLTDRVLSLMVTGTAPQRILCLTFTKAAAAEMANRIARRLSIWTTLDDAKLTDELTALLDGAVDDALRVRARQLFARVLDAPGGMHIQTIHAFCQSLLRRFPLEAALPPHFTVMDERDAAELMGAAQAEILATQDDAPLAAALRLVTAHVHETNFADLLANISRERGRLRRLLTNGFDAAMAAVRDHLDLAADDTPDTVRRAACDEVAFDGPALRHGVEVLLGGTKTDIKRGEMLARWLAADGDERARTLGDYADAFLTLKGVVRGTLLTSKPAAAHPQVVETLSAEAERLIRFKLRLNAAITAEATEALLRLADGVLTRYEAHKAARALLDYDDLILTARRLLNADGVAAWVLFKLDGGIDHILIDEAQDTNPDQWQVVEALAEEFFAGRGTYETPRTVFAVGDAKQSIYSFQRADPAEFERMRALFAKRVPAAAKKWREVDLDVSFRSTRAVLAAVDKVFAGPAADGVVPTGAKLHHRAHRADDAGRVEIWPPVAGRGGVEPGPWKPPVERITADSPRARLARLIAEKISVMTGADGGPGEMLSSAGRAMTPGDIMVLVRSRTGFVEDLVRELKARAVAVAGVDRMVLTDQIAVMDVMALGRFLLLPDDDLTLATVLKSPLVGLNEDQLFTLAYGRGGSLWAALDRKAGDDPAFVAARSYLSALLARADFVPPFELFADILGPRGGRERLLARLGPEVEDPLNEFMDLCLTYERAHTPSLQGVLQWLDSGAVEIKRDMETARTSAVRVMTVHGAKGLQAPVVFLPDTMGLSTKGPGLLWPRSTAAKAGQDEHLMLWPPRKAFYPEAAHKERDRWDVEQLREHRRLLYVAMTRAEDRLIVCGAFTKKQKTPQAGCWYDLITAAIAEGEPEVTAADDPFLARMDETEGARVLSMSCPQDGDPSTTDKGPAPVTVDGPLPDWVRQPPPVEPDPVQPLTPSKTDDAPAVRSPLGEGGGNPFKRGQLIHRLLQTLPDLAPELRAEAARTWLANQGDDVDIDALTAETLAVLDDPAFAPLFGPGSLAEVPISGVVARSDGGVSGVYSGQMDRLCVTDDVVWIVDYKTNRPPPVRVADVAPVYARQLAAYRALLRGIYAGRIIRCALLWTDGPRLMEMPDDLLDLHAP